jgi:hypothetical protein
MVSEFLLCISETLKIVPLTDAQQLLMLSAGTLTYSEERKLSLSYFLICYNSYYYYYYYMYVCMYVCMNIILSCHITA